MRAGAMTLVGLDLLIAESQIRALSASYARGLDRQDEGLVRVVFAHDATTHYGIFTGGPDEMAAMAMRALGQHTATQHFIGQINITFTTDEHASGEVYFQAYHRSTTNGVPSDRFICGRYVDRYRCARGSWLIAHRTEVVDWTRTEPAADDYFLKRPETVRGTRNRADLSYRPEDA